MNGQLFGTLKMGRRFHYYGDHEHIYIKTDDNFAVDSNNPAGGIHPGAGVLVFTFDYYEHDNHGAHIGYLKDGHFVCPNCLDAHHDGHADASVYLVNVTPYKQTCHDCKRLVVLGKTPAWCELWD